MAFDFDFVWGRLVDAIFRIIVSARHGARQLGKAYFLCYALKLGQNMAILALVENIDFFPFFSPGTNRHFFCRLGFLVSAPQVSWFQFGTPIVLVSV